METLHIFTFLLFCVGAIVFVSAAIYFLQGLEGKNHATCSDVECHCPPAVAEQEANMSFAAKETAVFLIIALSHPTTSKLDHAETYHADAYYAETYHADAYYAETYHVDAYYADAYYAETYHAKAYYADNYLINAYDAEGHHSAAYHAEAYHAETYDAEAYHAEAYHAEAYHAETYHTETCHDY
ncbi:hypothetical protein MRX96_028936 [Rhipicephalus microplus]